jgi:hypothetical protein
MSRCNHNVHAKFPDGPIKCAWCEIERLKADNLQLQEVVEKLGGRVERLRGYNEDHRKEIEQLKQDFTNKRYEHVSGCVIVPLERIDAAVKMVEGWNEDPQWYAAGWNLLYKLFPGIQRCERCMTEGILGIQGNIDPNTGEDMGPCSACQGKQWVLHG